MGEREEVELEREDAAARHGRGRSKRALILSPSTVTSLFERMLLISSLPPGSHLHSLAAQAGRLLLDARHGCSFP